MDTVQRIHLNLSVTRVSLAAIVARILARGETIEHIEAVSDMVCETGKAFEQEAERHTRTPLQRCCGRGRWLQWVCPCIPICRWLGITQWATLLYIDAQDWWREHVTATLTRLRGVLSCQGTRTPAASN